MSLLDKFEVQKLGFNGLYEPHVGSYFRDPPRFSIRTHKSKIDGPYNGSFRIEIEDDTKTFIEDVYKKANSYDPFGDLSPPITGNCLTVDGRFNLAKYGQIIDIELRFVGGTYNKGRNAYFGIEIDYMETYSEHDIEDV